MKRISLLAHTARWTGPRPRSVRARHAQITAYFTAMGIRIRPRER